MTAERFKLIPEAHLLLVRNDSILLLKRCNTGYEAGKYSVVAGHLDGNETATQAMAREAFEEAGIVIDRDDLTLVHVMHRRHLDERVSFFFTAARWSGTPENNEPDKCEDLYWCPIDRLPEDTIPYIVHAIACYRKNIHYSEFGWGNTAPTRTTG
ncbi:NUDIX domain-containing protein [Candidatus Bipolaricaulota bacterium]